MPVASGSGAPRYVPPVDDRDQGQLSEDQRLISYHLAKFLRHEAPKKHLGDWVDVETILSELERGHTLTVSRDDLMAVVLESKSKDVRRFDDWTDSSGKIMVRANNADHYRTRGSRARGNRRGDYRDDRSDCSDWSDWSRAGSSASRPSNGRMNRGSWRPPGSYAERDYGGSAKFPEVPEHAPASSSASWPWPEHQDQGASEAKASPSCFDGNWVSKEGVESSISGTTLIWHVDGQDLPPAELYISDRKIWVPEDNASARHRKTQFCEGWLDEAGQVISFYDGDVWHRKVEAATQSEASTAPTASSGYAEKREDAGDWQATGAGAEGDAPSSADAPPSAEGGNLWVDMRVRNDFDATAFGDDYLSLQKGELLSVRPGTEEGWVYGYSMQRAKYGWFPPTYAYTESP